MIDPATAMMAMQVVGGLLGKKKNKGKPAIPAQGVYEGYNNNAAFKDSGFIDKTLPNALMGLFNKPYQGRPFERVSMSEGQDPNFAPQGVMGLQRFYDKQAAQEAQMPQAQPQQQQQSQQANPDMQSQLDQLFARQQVQGEQGKYLGMKADNSLKNMQGMSPEMLAKLGELLRTKKASIGSGMYAGGIVSNDGKPLDLGGMR